jgi:two-component system chemotaxis sensor kinase CheA
LNVPNVVRTALGSTTQSNVIATEGEKTVKTRTRLLVVDDSVTTRTLMKSILETANYNVTAAVDGQHAWECMQNDSFDLVVSDVEMPRMDGFELTSSIRGVPTFNELPVILVTARGTDEDKARGIQVGANAYLVKSSFDQRNLLETIEQLI